MVVLYSVVMLVFIGPTIMKAKELTNYSMKTALLPLVKPDIFKVIALVVFCGINYGRFEAHSQGIRILGSIFISMLEVFIIFGTMTLFNSNKELSNKQ